MIPAERVVPVTPLATDADGDAVELFVNRARAARPEFALDAATTPTVVELCRRLDGIPLAIELAAARTRSIAPAKILERLDERFRMLTGGSRTAVARHQTLAGRGRLVLRAARPKPNARCSIGCRCSREGSRSTPRRWSRATTRSTRSTCWST